MLCSAYLMLAVVTYHRVLASSLEESIAGGQVQHER
jgi:hypothetical protein